ncbi:MAG: ABC transporter permease [Deltaproteobacteria bacterium]|nr:ABC transporter permease [Deltaproteobacteria bacterium]
MAWRNIWRNPRRTLLTVSAIAFACVLLIFMLSFQFGSYETMINAAVKIQTGHFQVQDKRYREKRDIRHTVENPEAVDAVLDRTKGVAAYTHRAEAFSIVSSKDRTYGALVIGIDPVREAGVSTLKSLVRDGEYLSESDRARALVGRLLARNLKVGIGDELTLLGQGRDGSVAAAVVTVKGVYSSGQDDFDRAGIHITLHDFQEIYSMSGEVHQVVALVDALSNVSEIARRVQVEVKKLETGDDLVVLDWSEIMPGLKQAISMDLVSGLIFWLLLIIVVAFSILNTFLMAIFERKREFGVMMAIGTAPSRLTKIVLMESMFMTLVGIAAGIILGIVVTLYFEGHGIDIGGAGELLKQYGISGRMYPKLSVLSTSIGPAMVFCITFLAALYPALKVRRLKPVEAMTSG